MWHILHLDHLIQVAGHAVNLLVEVPAVHLGAWRYGVGADVTRNRSVLSLRLGHEDAQVDDLGIVALGLHEVEEFAGLDELRVGRITDIEEERGDADIAQLLLLHGGLKK